VRALDAPWLAGMSRAELWDWLDAQLPRECLVYVTVDLDAIDPSEVPAVNLSQNAPPPHATLLTVDASPALVRVLGGRPAARAGAGGDHGIAKM
jgi:hypothetical protein